MSDEKPWYDNLFEYTKRIKDVWGTFSWFRERFKSTFSGAADASGAPGILMIGPGGTGKTTLARTLSGQMLDWLIGEDWKYAESYFEEHYALLSDPQVELIVPSGQEFRRPASWADVRRDVSNGRYAGIILVASFGYHTFSGQGFKSHRLFDGSKERFMTRFLEEKHKEEIAVLEQIKPALETAPGKLWVLTAVTKQDLWWSRRQEVDEIFTSGVWGSMLRDVASKRDEQTFTSEVAFVSLLPANLEDPEGIELARTAAGYDRQKQSASMQSLLKKLDALKNWEGSS
jgi:hypothetical protein